MPGSRSPCKGRVEVKGGVGGESRDGGVVIEVEEMLTAESIVT